VRSLWNGQVIADSDDTVISRGKPLLRRRIGKLGGVASIRGAHDLPMEGASLVLHPRGRRKVNRDAAWYYESPSSAAAQIKELIAFWKAVTVTE